MKNHHSIAWGLFALAVVSSPLTLDQVLPHTPTHHGYRSIASDEAVKPVDEHAALNGFLEKNKEELAKVEKPEPLNTDKYEYKDLLAELLSVGSGASELEVEFVKLHDKVKEPLSDGEKQGLESQRQALLREVGHFALAEKLIKDRAADDTVPQADRDSTALNLVSTKSQLNFSIEQLDRLDKKIAEFKPVVVEVKPEVKPSVETDVKPEVKPEESKLSKEQQARLDKADKIIAQQERLERERSCAASRTPAVLTPQVTDLSNQQMQMMMMMMTMLQTNQTMISMMQMNMQLQQQPSWLGSYFNQPQWPSQSYGMMGLGNPTQYQLNIPGMPQTQYGMQGQPQSTTTNNYYGTGQSQQGMPGGYLMNPQMGMQNSQPSIPGAVNFGSDLPGATFGNFQVPQIAPAITQLR